MPSSRTKRGTRGRRGTRGTRGRRVRKGGAPKIADYSSEENNCNTDLFEEIKSMINKIGKIKYFQYTNKDSDKILEEKLKEISKNIKNIEDKDSNCIEPLIELALEKYNNLSNKHEDKKNKLRLYIIFPLAIIKGEHDKNPKFWKPLYDRML
jgi:hypothetical protein